MSMERVCVYVLPPEIKGPACVCLCLGTEKKRQTLSWREAVDGEKEGMCSGFKKQIKM